MNNSENNFAAAALAFRRERRATRVAERKEAT